MSRVAVLVPSLRRQVWKELRAADAAVSEALRRNRNMVLVRESRAQIPARERAAASRARQLHALRGK